MMNATDRSNSSSLSRDAECESHRRVGLNMVETYPVAREKINHLFHALLGELDIVIMRSDMAGMTLKPQQRSEHARPSLAQVDRDQPGPVALNVIAVAPRSGTC